MHYHVLAGFHGCIPESNVGPFTSLVDARIELKMEVNELRDSGNTLKGNLKHCYFELIKKTTALCDYLEISKCFENSCFESDPGRFETELTDSFLDSNKSILEITEENNQFGKSE